MHLRRTYLAHEACACVKHADPQEALLLATYAYTCYVVYISWYVYTIHGIVYGV